MEGINLEIFLKQLYIEDVRGLSNINISIGTERKHLILTGKNGSGKTSVLNAIASYLNGLSVDLSIYHNMNNIDNEKKHKEDLIKANASENSIYLQEQKIEQALLSVEKCKQGVDFELNQPINSLYASFSQGKYILGFYGSERNFKTIIPNHISKVKLKNNYSIDDNVKDEFLKFLLDLKMTEALSIVENNTEKSSNIKQWFVNFEDLLKEIFDETSLKLVFNIETYEFTLQVDNKPSFGFNELSSGYSAVLDIVIDIILRMEHSTNQKFLFNMPGIILIDEIETHLHIELQKKILKFLTTIFPNIQFIITTHSPFILNSLDNIVIYDLEKRILVENGLTNVSYEGIVESYFNVDTMSDEILSKFNEYKELVLKSETTELSPKEYIQIDKLEQTLDTIPNYLSIEFVAEYNRLKLELESRGDL